MKKGRAALFALLVVGALLSGCVGSSQTTKDRVAIREEATTPKVSAAPKVTSTPAQTLSAPTPQPKTEEIVVISDEEVQTFEADMADLEDFLSDMDDVDIDLSELNLEAF